jgi:hypothetical protein
MRLAAPPAATRPRPGRSGSGCRRRGLEPGLMLVGRPRPERCMRCDLRFLCAGGDRWCPARTWGFWWRADPMRTRATTITAGSGPLRCAAAGGARPPRAVTDRSAVSGWPFLLWEGLGGAGHWSALAASRPGLRKVRLCEGGSWLSRRLACSVRCRQSQETHEFYAASASVLDMPRVWGSLRLCQVWRVGRGALCGSVRHSPAVRR